VSHNHNRSQWGRVGYAAFIVLLLAVAVAGVVLFIEGYPRASTAAAAPSPAGFSSGRIADFRRLPASERTKKLARIVARKEEPCTATDTIYKGEDADGSAYYALTCSNGASWMVLLVNNAEGTNLVTSCKTMEKVGGDCFEVWE
jgi:hypothetical protein